MTDVQPPPEPARLSQEEAEALIKAIADVEREEAAQQVATGRDATPPPTEHP